jgi:hypothetical protein
MVKVMKKLIAVILNALLVVIIIAGCTSSKGDDSGKSDASVHSSGESSYVALKDPIQDLETDDRVKAALSGDIEAAESLSFNMGPGSNDEYWVSIAIENGSQNMYGRYASELVGRSPARCYRAIFFLGKAIEVETSSILLDQHNRWLSLLVEQKNRTNFKCGCSISIQNDVVDKCIKDKDRKKGSG